MIVVADSSPLIFFTKLERLNLLRRLFGNRLTIPSQVRDEVLRPRIQSDDAYVLSKFIDECNVVPVSRPRKFSTALSAADNAVLTLAVRKKAGRILVDERLMRRIASAEGIQVTGTIGILFAASQRRLLSPEEAVNDLRRLVRSCGFRISTAVYDAAMEAISKV
ncbi:MAG: DUF3368 domain-containing protein [Deltaproteobacteria bacterium]|nr:DUF3368 domain-containing protein [Deltaproteobacteria bacterium]